MIGTCAVLIVVSLGVVFGQSGVAGRVVDTAGQALPGVTVMMFPASGGTQMKTYTGADGTYRFEKAPDGNYRVDFELLGFEVIRRNHVVVRNGRSTFADATLRVRSICECVTVTGLPPAAQRTGRVLDSENRPLPRARVEMVAPLSANRPGSPGTWREVAYTDDEGWFSFFAPRDSTWPVTVSDSGFRPVTRQVSGSVADPFVVRLAFSGTNLSSVQEYERFDEGCGCTGQLLRKRLPSQ